jgi:hypothetical protein
LLSEATGKDEKENENSEVERRILGRIGWMFSSLTFHSSIYSSPITRNAAGKNKSIKLYLLPSYVPAYLLEQKQNLAI